VCTLWPRAKLTAIGRTSPGRILKTKLESHNTTGSTKRTSQRQKRIVLKALLPARLHWLVLVLTKKVLCPYTYGAVALNHQEDTTDSMECALVPLRRRWPPDVVQRTTVP
jgi:predicted RNase H-like nuclease